MPPQPTQTPSPSPSPDPPTSPPASPSDREAASSTGSSAASDFIVDPGPAFDPEGGPAAPLFDDELAEEPEGWQETTIRELLLTQGEITHYVLKVGDEDTDSWKHTADDLHRIAPPLTRLLNRYDVTRAAAVAGDEASLAAALASYAGKNYVRRRRLLAARAAAQVDVPITGRAAEPGTGPEHDPQWRGERGEPVTSSLADVPPALTPKGR